MSTGRLALAGEGTRPRGIEAQVRADGTIDLWGYDVDPADWEALKSHIDGHENLPRPTRLTEDGASRKPPGKTKGSE